MLNQTRRLMIMLTRASARNWSTRLTSTDSSSSTSSSTSTSTSSSSSSSSSSDSSSYSVNFGFEQVKSEEKQGKVNEVFDNVASKYDVMNDAMSFGLHRVWKNEFIRQIGPNHNMRLLDVAGGTGDIAFRFLDQLKFAKQPVTTTTNDEKDNADKPKSNETKITVCDINANMLSFGKKRAIELNYADAIRWQVGNAEKLVTEADNSYDVYTIAFGIRNCTNLANVVREAHRVLRPGGVFMCLEFSHAQSNAFKSLYDFYSFEVIPVMGYLIAGDWKSYQYLVESIRVFPKQDEFAQLISDCGFRQVSYRNLTDGIVAIHSGFKF